MNEDGTPIAEPVDPAAEQARVEGLVDETLGITPPKVEDKPSENDAPDTQDEPVDEELPDDADTEEDEQEDIEPPVDQKPSDEELYIEVEDASGNKYKISKETDLPEDFTPKNNRQIIEILSDLQKLNVKIENRDAERVTAEQTAIVEARKTEISSAWDSEINQLIDEKVLSKPKLASNNPKYNEDPAVKAVDDTYKFMMDENDKRKAAGNPNLLTSFRDAFELRAYRDSKVQQAEHDKKAQDLAKAKAGLIGSGGGSSGTDGYIYRAGSARTIDEV